MYRLSTAFLLCFFTASAAHAQRAGENVLTSAVDAFGTTLGRDSFGLYDQMQIRGFSPTVAGNIRILGMNFDQQQMLQRSIRLGSSVRVGIATLGFPFPAPTGVVDFSLRVPVGKEGGSATIGLQERYRFNADFDNEIKLTDSFSMTVAALGEYRNVLDGNKGTLISMGVTGRYKPSADVEIVPFFGTNIKSNDFAQPRWFTTDREEPDQQIDRLTIIGPDWAVESDFGINTGVVAKVRPAENWLVEAALFRSINIRSDWNSLLVRDIDDNGVGRRIVISDPRQYRASWSTEVRATRTITTGNVQHKLIAAVRGRKVFARIGGNVRTDLGLADLGERINIPRPVQQFGPQTIDKVRQGTVSLGYEGRWLQHAEFAGGVQFSDYQKRIDQPGQPLNTISEKPVLYNGILAVRVAPGFNIYGAYTSGFEESGGAPTEAANRNDLLPAQRTKQMELGFRLRLPWNMVLNSSAFRIEKPFFALDDNLFFGVRGQIRQQGIEASLNGSPFPGFTVVAGGLLLEPGISGAAVDEGRIGRLAIDLAGFQGKVALDWRPGGNSPFSFDAVFEGNTPKQATRDNLVQSRAAFDVNLGTRYRFKMGKNDATLRLQVANIFNSFRWNVVGDGAWRPNNPRSVLAFVTVDI